MKTSIRLFQLLITLLFASNSFAQTYELQKIANILPADVTFNYLQMQSSNIGFSIKSEWANNGSRTENSIYEYNGTSWAPHSTYVNKFLTFRKVF